MVEEQGRKLYVYKNFSFIETKPMPDNIIDLPELREKTHVFQDRAHAGKVLAEMLKDFRQTDSIVLGIPAGGVPVGAVISKQLSLPFDVAVVSKITLPWNTEAGYGAIAFDGTLKLNKDMLPHLNLTEEDIQAGIKKTTEKVTQRIKKLRGKKPFPDLSQRKTILVDDGLASSFTMNAAVEAIKKAGASQIIVAAPTGHRMSVEWIAKNVEALYCPNIRSGWSFAVADAYQLWSDVTDEEVIKSLEELWKKGTKES
ncbi:MAG: phosphoribosyltransferase [Desulfobacteraceae bacterium]|nr:phosphoribosyltransferase [Desulfobacteraceae bacterium]